MKELIPGKEYHPFHCGTQFMDWMENNCYQCKKYVGDNEWDSEKECSIARHIENCAASIEEFTDEAMLQRMGYLKEDGETMEGFYSWPCTERVHVDAPDPEPPIFDHAQMALEGL